MKKLHTHCVLLRHCVSSPSPLYATPPFAPQNFSSLGLMVYLVVYCWFSVGSYRHSVQTHEVIWDVLSCSVASTSCRNMKQQRTVTMSWKNPRSLGPMSVVANRSIYFSLYSNRLGATLSDAKCFLNDSPQHRVCLTDQDLLHDEQWCFCTASISSVDCWYRLYIFLVHSVVLYCVWFNWTCM